MFSIAIQLSLFFVGTSAALWIDQVYNGNIGRLTQDPKLFLALMLVVLIVRFTQSRTVDVLIFHF